MQGPVVAAVFDFCVTTTVEGAADCVLMSVCMEIVVMNEVWTRVPA